MDAAHALSRAWQQFGIGLILLAFVLVQMVAGKALSPRRTSYGDRGQDAGRYWVPRKDQPQFFWFLVALYTAVGLIAVALGLPVILGLPAWG
jgi:hypothetical protein